MKISDGILSDLVFAKSCYSAEPGLPQNQVILQNRVIPQNRSISQNRVIPQSPDITHFLYSAMCSYPLKLPITNYF